jgi:hypothetical protein
LTLLLPEGRGGMGLWRTRQPPSLPPLGQVGPRLKQLGARRGLTLTRSPGGINPGKSTSRRVTANLRPSRTKGTSGCSPGRMRLVLGNQDLVLGPGEAAEFDTRVPHWFGRTGDQPAEIISTFGPQGVDAQAGARTLGRKASAE